MIKKFFEEDLRKTRTLRTPASQKSNYSKFQVNQTNSLVDLVMIPSVKRKGGITCAVYCGARGAIRDEERLALESKTFSGIWMSRLNFRVSAEVEEERIERRNRKFGEGT
ncbi:hypothetical protein EVAR_41207_1 [Eumeta japonica]|uniref:Uncharacterized protein n=1 Tax=Eumeta variegata TaxID=151549 RepID=A0A4C1WR74_EUMVA|nr:hypothetical protein EVAR_41207_1 [Eumeta japonica]